MAGHVRPGASEPFRRALQGPLRTGRIGRPSAPESGASARFGMPLAANETLQNRAVDEFCLARRAHPHASARPFLQA